VHELDSFFTASKKTLWRRRFPGAASLNVEHGIELGEEELEHLAEA
jgi:hypothetical protein